MSFELKPSVGTWWASQSFLPLDQGSTDSTGFETWKLATFEKKQYRAWQVFGTQSERIGAFPRFQRRRLLQVPNEDALRFSVWHSWVWPERNDSLTDMFMAIYGPIHIPLPSFAAVCAVAITRGKTTVRRWSHANMVKRAMMFILERIPQCRRQMPWRTDNGSCISRHNTVCRLHWASVPNVLETDGWQRWPLVFHIKGLLDTFAGWYVVWVETLRGHMVGISELSPFGSGLDRLNGFRNLKACHIWEKTIPCLASVWNSIWTDRCFSKVSEATAPPSSKRGRAMVFGLALLGFDQKETIP